MCGIAGIVSLKNKLASPDAITRMCDSIAHRGPDDAGYALFKPSQMHPLEFTGNGFRHKNPGMQAIDDLKNRLGYEVCLGHRRLSIIDLSSGGHQPMSIKSGRYWITYNGEIYNFPELKEELLSDGYSFSTRSDTEVLLALWDRYGKESVGKLNGMFAFAIYDSKAKKIVLARDRFGVKPLYYSVTGDYLVFASEPKAILASGLIQAKINTSAMAEYFTFQNILSDETLFQDIKILSPGKLLSCAVSGSGSISPETFHRHRFSPGPPLDGKGAAVSRKISSLFRKSVKSQLISDVEIGSYLSGGMDSGSIVSVAGRELPRMLTFTCGFDLTNVNGIEQGFDERKQAEKLSYLLQTEHYDVVLHAGDMPAAMEKISWHMDDPRVGMCHQNWYASKLAGKFVKVCLAGTGGDELFGGYPWRYSQLITAKSFEEFDRKCFNYWHRMFKPGEGSDFFNRDAVGSLGGCWESYLGVMSEAPRHEKKLSTEENMIQRALYFEIRTFLHGLLVTEDRISMAHSLETRVPFLDNNLAEFALGVHPSLKINLKGLNGRKRTGHIDSADGKSILRKAMGNYLPEEFTNQHKRGFSPPDENWFRGPSMDYIKDMLLSKKTLERPWFERKTIRSKLNEHFSGKSNHRLLIWSLLSFEWLQKHFIDKRYV